MRPARTAVLLTVAAAWSSAAWAHSPVPGIEGFYVGMLHPVTVPGQILLLAVVGLVSGFRGLRVARIPFAIFAASLVTGAALGRGVPGEAITGWMPLVAVLVTAPALFFRAGEAVARAVSGIGGLVVGLGSMPEPGPMHALVITLAGSLAGAPFIMLCVAAIADVARERLQPSRIATVAAAIAGAWLMAVATLLLALAMAESRLIAPAP
jgi:hypothetical protein